MSHQLCLACQSKQSTDLIEKLTQKQISHHQQPQITTSTILKQPITTPHHTTQHNHQSQHNTTTPTIELIIMFLSSMTYVVEWGNAPNQSVVIVVECYHGRVIILSFCPVQSSQPVFYSYSQTVRQSASMLQLQSES